MRIVPRRPQSVDGVIHQPRMSSHIVIRLKELAKDLGVSCVGICPATQPPHYEAFLDWLKAGFHGEMTYLATRKEAYRNPASILPNVRSLIMFGFPYDNVPTPAPRPGYGIIARYTRSKDYHHIVRQRLKPLEDMLIAECPGSSVRGVVDTAPLLERDFAQLAGLGWIGKNTSLIHPEQGSYMFLAALLTTAELEPDPPFTNDLCRRCSACLRSCPTGALVGPRTLDARRCLSYLTIELRGFVPQDLRDAIGHWFFGCDLCQEACPWNQKVSPAAVPEHGTEGRVINLIALFRWSEEEFRKVFRSTALWRAKRRGLLRNAAIVLGNQRYQSAWDVLVKGLRDPEPVVREACAWALVKIDHARAIQYVQSQLSQEPDPGVAACLSTYLQKARSSA